MWPSQNIWTLMYHIIFDCIVSFLSLKLVHWILWIMIIFPILISEARLTWKRTWISYALLIDVYIFNGKFLGFKNSFWLATVCFISFGGSIHQWWMITSIDIHNMPNDCRSRMNKRNYFNWLAENEGKTPAHSLSLSCNSLAPPSGDTGLIGLDLGAKNIIFCAI